LISRLSPVEKPKISIILATHNRENLLGEAINSLLNQSFEDFEIVIVDDASEDQTPRVIKDYLNKDDRIRSLRSEINIGPGAARNLGISHSNGEYIAIMDDDDLASSQRLELELLEFEKNPDIDFVFSCVIWLDDDLNEKSVFPGILINDKFPENPKDVFKLLFLESNKIPNTSIMTRRSIWDSFSYPEDPWIGEDWFLCMQLAASGIRMKSISQPLVQQRRGLNRKGLIVNSRSKTFRAQRKILNMIKEWLKENDLNDFDHLYKLALSNQIIRESRHFIGLMGFGMLIYAFILAPKNPKIAEQLSWYLQKISQKLHLSKKEL
jgi:glycosyltransferase involved in cell wall biosynthesis